ncbi:MAG TPA: peptide deformylase [bacterium]|nr:peptide deformylase [bacterium]
MKRPIVEFPDPSLHRIADPVEEINEEIRTILKDMVETMYAEDGVGLAAPQIGVSLRLAVIDVSGSTENDGPGLIKMVNPKITARDGEVDYEEGCLSVPGFRKKMKRARKLTVEYLDENGNRQSIEAEGLLAIAVQQEIDHLDGILIIDGASRIKQDLYLKRKNKAERERD